MKELKFYLQILLATAIVGAIVILAMNFTFAATLPTTITINGKTENYVTYRNALISKVTNKTIKHSEVKAYIQILNLENKIKRLKGWSIQQFNHDILSRKL